MNYLDIASRVEFDWRVVRDFLGLDEDSIQVQEGPANYEGTADTVGPAVVITVGGGPGQEIEGLFDGVTVAVDTAGDQRDPTGAKNLALWVDRLMLSVDRTRYIGGFRVIAVTRAGGRPTPVSVDSADRHHLACSYVWRVQYGSRPQ